MHKCMCCSDTPWIDLHGHPQTGPQRVRFRTGSNVATVHRLIILLSMGYSQWYLLGSQQALMQVYCIHEWIYPSVDWLVHLEQAVLLVKCCFGWRNQGIYYERWPFEKHSNAGLPNPSSCAPPNQLLNCKSHCGKIFHTAKKAFRE